VKQFLIAASEFGFTPSEDNLTISETKEAQVSSVEVQRARTK
jgi:hypothetical protein